MAKKMKSSWLKSKARALLMEDLKGGTIPLDEDEMSAEEAFWQRPEYAKTSKRLWPSRLKAARDRTKAKEARSKKDTDAFQNDNSLYPRPTHDKAGLPRWNGSQAQILLRYDLAQGQHTLLKPKDLHKSRPAYNKDYPLDYFRRKIYQELDTGKFQAYLHKKQRDKVDSLIDE